MFLTIAWVLPRYVSCNSNQPSKVFERYDITLFFSRFYTYLTKYTKLTAQKKQLVRMLEMLGTFRPFLLKK